MATAKRNSYLTEQEHARAEHLAATCADARPPYANLSEDDATLLHALFTGFHPLQARVSVRRSRGLAQGDDVIDLATLTPQERAELPF